MFELVSLSNEEGFPGNVHIEVHYWMMNDKNDLHIDYKAKTDAPTPIDLTNHAAFNLNGHNSNARIYNHEFKFFADNYLDKNEGETIVNGNMTPVANTRYDFRSFVALKDRMDRNSEGFDSYFVSNQQSGNKIIAT